MKNVSRDQGRKDTMKNKTDIDPAVDGDAGLPPYEAPRIRSGQAFEKVLLGSGCNFNFNIAFGCSEPQENCP